MQMMNIFKSYDVRGIYPKELNEELVYQIGRATVEYLQAQTIAIGRDNRDSSPSLAEALERGITEAGANVVDLGLLSTPMLYFASTDLDVDAAMIITASHNPKEYNGIKICKKNAAPVGLTSGLSKIRNIVLAQKFSPSKKIGTIARRNIKNSYNTFISSFADLQGEHFSIATDTACAMGALELPILEELSGVTLPVKLYDTLATPGTCPHEANPLKTDTLTELSKAVIASGAHMGVAFDGDADRIGFVDELGQPIPMDLITALLAKALLHIFPGSTILYDLRSSRAVKKVIEEGGGIAHECMVGHANIKRQMLDESALFAGELSGHYYFSFGGYTAEKGVLPAILLMNLMARTKKKLSELVSDVRLYAHSGEINLEVSNAQEILTQIKSQYADGELSELDGIKVSYSHWWFSLRSSNTEPLLRLNLEADTPKLMEEKKAEILSFIHRK